jgi:hypothetical protein
MMLNYLEIYLPQFSSYLLLLRQAPLLLSLTPINWHNIKSLYGLVQTLIRTARHYEFYFIGRNKRQDIEILMVVRIWNVVFWQLHHVFL